MVVILTKNEERQLARALASVSDIATRCVLVDSGSTDRTRDLAEEQEAEVLQHSWVNYATQFNWGLDQLLDDTHWV